MLDHLQIFYKCMGCGNTVDKDGGAMISMREILGGRAELKDLPQDIQKNLNTLLERINKIRTIYGKPMKVNDGLRIVQGGGSSKSKHLIGAAIDIDDDSNGTLWKWLMKPEQMKLLKDVGLWLEHGCWTHCSKGTWVHFQILPPTSGNRIYIPNSDPNPNPSFWDGKYDKKFD